jgi:hypothetical protein
MKRSINLLIVSIAALSMSSQELNENFLDSLPDDIRQDLEKKNSNKEQAATKI